MTALIFVRVLQCQLFLLIYLFLFLFFSCQVLQTASVENWGECPFSTSRPSLDVWDGSSPLYPVYHTVSERWIHWARWKHSWQQAFLYKDTIINVCVLQKCHIKCIPLLVTSKSLFTLYWVWWLTSLILLYQTPQLREICRKSCSSWSLRSLSWRSSLRWEGQWGLCWQRS